MNGQVRSFKEKQNIANEFISRINPYEKQENLKFDLRAYSNYVIQNGISAAAVNDELLEKFKK